MGKSHDMSDYYNEWPIGGGNEDILPLLMNMPRPPMIDPMTGLTMPQEQDPNQMMMMMALMGDKNNAMIPSR